MSNTYLFDVDVAKEYGVDAAVMIKLFQFWIQKNIANESNFYDNNYWTYNSLDAFEKMLPFWNKKQIARILDFLVEKEVLIKGNYNRTKFDRTVWYAFKSPENWISRKRDIDIPKTGNGTAKRIVDKMLRNQYGDYNTETGICQRKSRERAERFTTLMQKAAFAPDRVDTAAPRWYNRRERGLCKSPGTSVSQKGEWTLCHS